MTHIIQLNPQPFTDVIQLAQPRRTRKQTLGIISAGLLTGGALFLGGTALGAARLTTLAIGTARTLFGTPKRTALTVTGIGILQTSPKAREFVIEKLKDPTAAGREIGEIIEDPSRLQPTITQTPKEKILEVVKTAGLIGGAAAAAAALVAAAKRFGKIRAPVIPTIGAIPSVQLPTGILPAEPSISTKTQPLGAVQRPVEPKPTARPLDLPKITINNNPEINIRFTKSRKFINQQVLIKS